MSEREISLGEFLRHERERRGIAIEQVASATKVGIRTLHSLEADHYSELPAKPFIRGFVTSYCRFIGLDAKDVLARYDSYMSLKASERPNRESGHSGYVFEKKDGEQQSRTILLIAIVGFILTGGTAMIFLKPHMNSHRSAHLERLRAARSQKALAKEIGAAGANSLLPNSLPSGTPAIPATNPILNVNSTPNTGNASPNPNPSLTTSVAAPAPPAPTPAPQPPSATEPSQKSAAAAGTNPFDPLDSGLELKADEIHHRIVFKALADIWVRYQVDQRPVRKFVIRKGKTLILRAREEARFQVSNPNSVTFSYNGQGHKMVRDEKRASERQGDMTLFFPTELAEKVDKPFVDERPLPKTSDPLLESLAPVSGTTL